MGKKWTMLTVPAVALLLAVTAIAWACTVTVHAFEIAGEPDAGLDGTTINVAGTCNGCGAGSDRGLYQSNNTTGQVKVVGVDEHQTECTTGSALIGSVTLTGTVIGGSGVVKGPSGAKIVCAGIKTESLWDNYTVIGG